MRSATVAGEGEARLATVPGAPAESSRRRSAPRRRVVLALLLALTVAGCDEVDELLAPTSGTGDQPGVSPSFPDGATVHTVAVGETLESIALRYCGTTDAAAAIFAANVGLPQADGDALADLDRLEPGWDLDIRCGAIGSETATTSTVAPTSSTRERTLASHVVEAGDTLRTIALRLCGTADAVQSIFAANVGRTQPGGGALTDVDRIVPGWVLTIDCGAAGSSVTSTTAAPTTTNAPPAVHVVTAGDTLYSIAQERCGTVDAAGAIFAANVGRTQADGEALTDEDRIVPGWVLTIDCGTG